VDSLSGARVLVTGASGFIGSHLTRRLVGDGADVHALTSAVSSVYPTRLVDLRDDIVLHEANLNDQGAMRALARVVRPEYVFHLGAYTHVGKSWERIDECTQTNVAGTVNLLRAIEDTGYRRLVFTGTSEIYGAVEVPFREDAAVEPGSPYAVSKYAAERFCRMLQRGRGWPIVLLRPFNAYGPAQSPDRIIPEVIVRALEGRELQMTSGTQTREFNYVVDLVDGFVRAALTPGIEGELLNLGCGEEIPVADLATKILGLMGDPIKVKIGALPERPNEIPRMCSDSTKARELLGWDPAHTLDDGLRRTIEWYARELKSPNSSFVT
jgi:UDP-glucose 4-epimerase